MTDTDDIVPALAEAIESRRQELGLSPVELARAAGVSLAGIAPLRKGARRAYQTRLTRPICRVLGWTPDSIDRLLAGERAVTWQEQARLIQTQLEAAEGELARTRLALDAVDYTAFAEEADREARRAELTAQVARLQADAQHLLGAEIAARKEAERTATPPSPPAGHVTSSDELGGRVAVLEGELAGALSRLDVVERQLKSVARVVRELAERTTLPTGGGDEALRLDESPAER